MSEKDTQEMRELFLFELMTDDDLQALMPILREKFYGAGTKIFSEKERGETMFVIKKGSVKIVKQDGDVQKELITFSAGDFFGEVTLFEYAMRTASAKKYPWPQFPGNSSSGSGLTHRPRAALSNLK